MSTYVIIPAAGQGSRMGGPYPKQYMQVQGAPILVWTVRAFVDHPGIAGLVLVVPAGDEAHVRTMMIQYGCATGLQIVPGGADRQASVACGLAALPPDCDRVLVHDAARPLVTPEVIDRVLAGIAHGPVTAALPVFDTIKEVVDDTVIRTLERSKLWSIQTPQGFSHSMLEQAHAKAGDFKATDDCALVERCGERVSVVPGARENIKITAPADLPIAEAILAQRRGAPDFPGFGIGYDVHRLAPGRPLVLGGVTIPADYGLLGHSDADVLLHAVMDALLGAAGLGDIGRHFPDTDPAYAGISSLLLLHKVTEKLAAKGLRPQGVDIVLIAEKPRMAPYSAAMRTHIATALGLPEGAVNLKATTNERLGFVGREEGIAAQAVAWVREI